MLETCTCKFWLTRYVPAIFASFYREESPVVKSTLHIGSFDRVLIVQDRSLSEYFVTIVK